MCHNKELLPLLLAVMIKQILSKLFTQKPNDLECAIDEDKVDCEHLDDDQDKAYVGVPAPVLNPLDDWFSSSYGCPSAVTEKQKDYMERETELNNKNKTLLLNLQISIK